MAGTYGRRQRPRPGRRWRLPATRTQGVAPRLGLPPARAAASRSDQQQGQRPHKATPPTHEVTPEGNSIGRRGNCPRRRRAAPPPAQGQLWQRRIGGQGEG
ncbi:hypothetical protein GW17_00045348 [Ensete ventricosum]|nr:hypothetical protein GW17_00045348 [Ensete ventricosum]